MVGIMVVVEVEDLVEETVPATSWNKVVMGRTAFRKKRRV